MGTQKYKLPPMHVIIAAEAVARCGTVVRAAQELGVTPSAVSHRLRLLEKHLGNVLFLRNNQEMRLTDEGINFIHCANEVLGMLQRYQDGLKEDIAINPVVVTVPPTFARSILVPALKQFYVAHPGIRLSIRISIPVLDLYEGHTDVEIRFAKGKQASPSCIPLLNNEVTPVCSPTYLSHQQNIIKSPHDLLNINLLTCPFEPWSPWFDALGIPFSEPDNAMELADLGMLIEAAISGMGIALGRRPFIDPWIQAGSLVKPFAMVAKSPYRYYLSYKKHVLRRPEVRTFVDWVEGVFGEDKWFIQG